MGLADAVIEVTVVRSLAPRQVELLTLTLPAGSTVLQALQRCGWWAHEQEAEKPAVGVWGKLQAPDHVLRDKDRVEIYRGLRVDPKQARRERYADHKARIKAAEEVAAKRKRQR
jgi:putative ubiquitin-RnfH superfamily antitoxin RatB of RatAB toxin-antitoxin module